MLEISLQLPSPLSSNTPLHILSGALQGSLQPSPLLHPSWPLSCHSACSKGWCPGPKSPTRFYFSSTRWGLRDHDCPSPSAALISSLALARYLPSISWESLRLRFAGLSLGGHLIAGGRPKQREGTGFQKYRTLTTGSLGNNF